MTEPAEDLDWRCWHEPGSVEVAPGVHRLPLSLPMDGLRAVNVYVLRSRERVMLLDAGWAIERAEAELVDGLDELGLGIGDVTDFLVTHAHRDHYTMAAALRRRFGARLTLGEPERVNMEALQRREPWDVVPQRELLIRSGAPDLAEVMGTMDAPFDRSDWPMPDVWVADRQQLDLGDRSMTAIHTPGHTRGHFIFHDEAHQLLFTGDHVLPHITPSIGFEQVPPSSPLRDYLASLHLLKTMPDATMLPGHGAVGASVHERVDELLAHHDDRLDATLTAVASGAATAHEVARCLTWTGRGRRLDELDDFNRMLAILETYWHLEVLAERGRLARSGGDSGPVVFETGGRTS
ncbi:MAG TPA: MBL fold metallo-hydrolase [Intrasporangium sp.]|uniref:MBL fold metallo-hydrolase n=1 Tax=Intrasporangium sp. TaxID=1925024 RepID=UPI002D76C63C|nr:MBL fold metallo-hydrolase [Intrasporangium sp.]HET7399865.1 MBL fold metallo-hydrolase [Intrasporangium sp.]